MASIVKGIEKKAARIAGTRPEFAAEVRQVEALVKAEAARHSHSGTFASSIQVKRGRVDSHIISSDPRAWNKEFGHLTPGGKKWVPGIFAFTNAAKKAI